MGSDLMTAEPAAPEQTPAEASTRRGMDARAAEIGVALVPGAAVIYLGFNGGGYFPGTVGFATLLVLQLLLARVLLAERPFDGFGRAAAVAGAAFAAFAGWNLASGAWSHAGDRALIEFDRVLLYATMFALFASVPRRQETMRWMVRGLAIGIVVVCGAGLITRVLPHFWPTSADVANNRLSFPVTYWNAEGILAAIGILVLLGLASARSERAAVRVLAAAGVPLVSTTLFFTFSRGAIAALIVGLVAYVLAARPKNAIIGLLAAAPGTAIALVVAYHAGALATLDPTTPRAVSQGHTVAIALVICILATAALRLLTLRIDRRLSDFRAGARARRAIRLSTAGVALIAVIVAIAAGAPSWISREYHTFVRGAPVSATDFRSRLTDPSSNGRTDHWKVALSSFSDSSLHGAGAGTYEFTWAQHRHIPAIVADAHSLYLEFMSELGIVGLLLFLVPLIAILVAVARRARGPNRMIYAGLFGAALAWAIHAGVDWDWEMPVVTAWVFAVGGAALARRLPSGERPAAGQSGRVPLAVGLLVICVAPALIMLSQAHLQSAANAFDNDNCSAAQRHAVSSINTLAIRPEPYQILAYCDMASGRVDEAVAAMHKAIEQEPKDWQYRYGLGLAQAASGVDPHPALREAAQLNPMEGLVKDAETYFAGSSPAKWESASATARREALDSGKLSMR